MNILVEKSLKLVKVLKKKIEKFDEIFKKTIEII